MSSKVVERSPITYALKAVIETLTIFPVGVASGPYTSGPEPVPEVPPYIVIHPRGKGRFWGSVDSPWECLAAQYQIKSIGNRDDQAQMIADRVRSGLLSREFNGAFTNPLVMTNQVVMDIAPALNGPGDLVKRANLYEIDDVITITVTAV